MRRCTERGEEPEALQIEEIKPQPHKPRFAFFEFSFFPHQNGLFAKRYFLSHSCRDELYLPLLLLE
jgi:hypothetical protein